MIVSFVASPKLLQGVALAASKDQTRRILNGVQVEVTAQGKLTMVATNGKLLVCANARKLGVQDVTVRQPGSVIIPADFIERTSRFFSGFKLVEYKIDTTNDTSDWISVRGGDYNIKGILIAGDYPKWRNVIPTQELAVTDMGFAGQYMKLFSNVNSYLNGAAGISGSGLRLWYSGPMAAFRICPLDHTGWVGVFMPMRDGDTEWKKELGSLVEE